jgi:hypothetical protein
MERIPLFTRDDLARAFALIRPPAPAVEYAARWWDSFAEDAVDEHGRWLYEREEPRAEPNAVAYRASEPAPGEVTTGGYEVFRGRPVEEKGDFLLRFSDFHLYLAAITTDDLARRVQAVYGDSDEQAAHRRRQMRAIVAVMRE